MNGRIRELAKTIQRERHWTENDIEKFGQLIVRECEETLAKVWYEQGLDVRGAELGKFLTRFEEHFGVK